VVSRPAAGGGRWVEVDPGRLEKWLAGFAERHGAVTTHPLPDGLALAGADGAEAECHLLAGAAADRDGLVAAALAPVRFGLLLVRRGGFAVGVARGDADNQTRQAWQSAAEAAERVLLPAAGDLAALVGGGDRRAVESILAEPRLAPLAALGPQPFLDVPEPRLAVLEQAVRSARAVRIRLVP
jgi:hypothetical protein